MKRSLALPASALLVLLSIASASCRHAPKAAPEYSDALAARELQRLSDDFWDLEMRRNPIWATYLSDRRFDAELPDLTNEGRARALEHARFIHEAAKKLDPAQLSAQDRITRETLLSMLEGTLESEVCQLPLWDVNALDGVQTILGELPQLHGISQPEHADTLITRFEKSGHFLDAHLSNLRQGQQSGYLAAKVAVVRVIEQLDSMLQDPPERSSFVTTVVFPKGWDAAKTTELTARLTEAVKTQLYPGLQRYRDFLKNEYLASAREEVGVTSNKDGAACYRARILAHTHLTLSPEEIHEIGKQQAEANLAEMKAIAKRLTGKEELEALKAHLAADPSQRVKSREELMKFAEGLIARAHEKTAPLFGRLPRQEVRVKAIEAFREQSSPTGYYYSGSESENRPGYFYLNTYKPETRVLYLLESLTFHEAVPGHHLQGALSQELEGIPRFRRELGDGAFVEGWAHYAELLADEQGLYSGDAGRFGMLSDQSLRAVRLVVDTGMHHLGWTREQALDYMTSHTAEPREEAAREIDRYIVWPGQALAYKLGQLEILKLRREAQEKLGDRFDIRAFHDALLSNGAVPLPVLRGLMGEWSGGRGAGYGVAERQRR